VQIKSLRFVNAKYLFYSNEFYHALHARPSSPNVYLQNETPCKWLRRSIP